MRVKTFGFAFEVNDEFAKQQPDAAAEYIAISKQRVAKQATAVGPRGGTYELITPPDEWRASRDGYSFARGYTQYSTTRQGRYVRPSRAPVPIPSLTFDTIAIPVVDGGVTIPSGERIETGSRYVTVPVLS